MFLVARGGLKVAFSQSRVHCSVLFSKVLHCLGDPKRDPNLENYPDNGSWVAEGFPRGFDTILEKTVFLLYQKLLDFLLFAAWFLLLPCVSVHTVLTRRLIS